MEHNQQVEQDAKIWLQERLPALLSSAESLPKGLKFSLRLPDAGSWTIDLMNRPGSCSAGEHDGTQCTLELAGPDLMKVVAQPDAALELYDAGRIALTGSVEAALEVVTFFHRVGNRGRAAWTPPEDPKDFVYNPLSPGFDEDPFPVYAYLRKHQPVFYWKDLRYWLLSRYDDARALLTDARFTTDNTFALAPAAAARKSDDLIEWLLERSPLRLSAEKHAIVRKLIGPVLSASAIERFRPQAEQLVAEIVAPLAEAPLVNMVDAFTEAYPRRFIQEILGIPAEYRSVFESFCEALLNSLITRPQNMDPQRVSDAVSNGVAALHEIIAEKRRKPGADVLSAMITSEKQGDRLDVDDVLSLVATLTTTGVDSSVYALNQTLLCLLRFPDQLRLLQREPRLIGNLLDEVLRFDNFHKLGIPRWATEDVELRGSVIRKGDAVAALLQSAGRDEEVFPDADVFDVRRELKATLTFGLGRHSCVGAAISQLEWDVGFNHLIRNYPDIQLAGAPEYRPQVYVRALKDIPVSLRPASARSRLAARRGVAKAQRAAMPLRPFGSTDLRVSALALGGVTFGNSKTVMKNRTASNDEARRIFDTALDAGINFVDTANVYSEGQSEELIGEWLRGRRDRVVLATKCRYPMGFGMLGAVGAHDQGLSRQHIIRACEESLRRLSTDTIDLYQVQAQDTSVPIEETLRALEDLATQGKVRHVGCSTYSGYRLTESLWVAERAGTVRFASAQAQWSLLNRSAERELIPACRAFGLAIMAWSPLAQGFLSGSYRRGEPPTAGLDARTRSAVYRTFDNEHTWAVLEAVERIASEHETTAAAVALAWVLARPGVSSVVVTARSTSQLDEALDALAVNLSPQDLATLDQVSAIDWGYPYNQIGAASSW